jgi:acyl carrier protein
MNEKNIEAICPLSPQQKGMLFGTVCFPASGIYVEQFSGALEGDSDIPAFQQAWQRVVDRHSILRTAFLWKEQDEPLQVVLQRLEAPLELQDWRGLSPPEQQEQLDAYLKADRGRGFDLSQPPLIRVALLQTSESRYQLVLTAHHIVIDGWSQHVLLKEFFSSYHALRTGQEFELEPSRPYRDYIAWLQQQDLSLAERFWRKTRQGFTRPTPLGMSTDSYRSDNEQERYGNREARLPATAVSTLQSLARQHRLTLNTLMQGAWALLLSRYGDEEDIVFGITAAGRPPTLEGVESIIGLFINTLPLRVKVPSEGSFWPWAKDIHAINVELMQYEHTSGGQVHQWSDVPGSLPLCESILVFENYPVHTSVIESAGLSIDIPSVRFKGAQTQFPLTILVIPGPTSMSDPSLELQFLLFYDRLRFDDSDMAWVLKHFLALLRAIIAEPQPYLRSLLDRIPADQIPRFRPLEKCNLEKSGAAFVPPRTPTEETLAVIWAQVLGVEKVGIDDNFFELSGHSLQATQLISKISAAMNRDVPLRFLFLHPTIAALANAVEGLPLDSQDSNQAHSKAGGGALFAVPPDGSPVQQSSPFLELERRPLLPLIAAGKVAPVDAAALLYLPISLLEYTGVSRDEVVHDWCGNLPVVVSILETFLGRIACLLLPRFGSELYSDEEDLVGVITDALETAGRLGARTVSLPGLLPSATDYGRAIAAAVDGRKELPMISTGHATTAATVVMAIRRILEEGGRDLSREQVGFLGLGSIGIASLRLMLRSLPHPTNIILCDLYSKLGLLEEIQRELVDDLGYRGSVRVVESQGEVPRELYETTLIIAATNMPNVLDIARVKPGTMIVDDSYPQCFAPEPAIRRFCEKEDILFTEAGWLRLPHPISELRYLPRPLEDVIKATGMGEAYLRPFPYETGGCIMSSLLSSCFEDLKPTVGMVDVDACRQHYEKLGLLGFQAADLHCDGYALAEESIGNFRQRFGSGIPPERAVSLTAAPPPAGDA